jgi:hypothetical protein
VPARCHCSSVACRSVLTVVSSSLSEFYFTSYNCIMHIQGLWVLSLLMRCKISVAPSTELWMVVDVVPLDPCVLLA